MSGRTPEGAVPLDFGPYRQRLNRPLALRIADMQRNGRLRHLLTAAQFTPGLLQRLFRTADQIRYLNRNRDGADILRNLLPHRRAFLYFTQPSTRTFESFASASEMLGMSHSSLRDVGVSSEAKGESAFDSIRVSSENRHLIIMRTAVPQLCEACAYMLDDYLTPEHRQCYVINAGSGRDEHPTQALLDIYSLHRVFAFARETDSSSQSYLGELRQSFPRLEPGIKGKVIGFCGDVRRSRTIRSLAQVLTLYPDVTCVFICPKGEHYGLGDSLRSMLARERVRVVEVESFLEPFDGAPAIEQLDALYMTRFQREYDEGPEPDDEHLDLNRYKLTPDLVRRMRPYAAILHPLPRDQHFGEIPTAIDNDRRAYYFRQVRNGLWARAALVAHVFDVDGEVSDKYLEHSSRRGLALD